MGQLKLTAISQLNWMHMSNTTPTTTSDTPTPYIAVAANYFGTGKSAQEARKNLVKAGGSPQETQTVIKLPEGAVNAYAADNGEVYWFGAKGDARPVFRYVNGKAVAWTQGEDKPIPYREPVVKPKHSPNAQNEGEATPEPALVTDKESTIAATDIPSNKPRKPAKKPAKVEPEVETVGESSQEPTDAQVAAAAKARKPGKKPAAAVEAAPEQAQPTEVQETPPATATAQGSGPDGKPGKEATARGRSISDKASKTAAKAAPAPTKEPTTTAGESADFLMFVGGAHYTKQVFIEEAAKLGISRRLPSHRLPKGLVCGTSKIYLACEGGRKTDGTPQAEVFGYFVPGQVQFMNMGNKQEYVDIVAALKLRKDTKIVETIAGEPERACGFRQPGGTYLVVDKADSPLKLLDKPAHYVGNHFRGMLRLNDIQARQFNTGGQVVTLVDEKCMKCGGEMKCAPDGHARAERERKRIAKGQEPKWLLLDAKCQKEVRAARAVDDGPQSADEEQGQEPTEATAE